MSEPLNGLRYFIPLCIIVAVVLAGQSEPSEHGVLDRMARQATASPITQLSKEMTTLNQILGALAIAPEILSGQIKVENVLKEMFTFGPHNLDTMSNLGLDTLERDLSEMEKTFEEGCQGGCGSKEMQELFRILTEMKNSTSYRDGNELGKIGEINAIMNGFTNVAVPNVNALVTTLNSVATHTEDKDSDIIILMSEIKKDSDKVLANFGEFAKLYVILTSFNTSELTSAADRLANVSNLPLFSGNASQSLKQLPATIDAIVDKLRGFNITVNLNGPEYQSFKDIANSSAPKVAKLSSIYKLGNLDLTQTRLNLALTNGKDSGAADIFKAMDPVVQFETIAKPWTDARKNLEFSSDFGQKLTTFEQNFSVIRSIIRGVLSSLRPNSSFKQCIDNVNVTAFSPSEVAGVKSMVSGLATPVKNLVSSLQGKTMTDRTFGHLTTLKDSLPLRNATDWKAEMKALKKKNQEISSILQDLDTLKGLFNTLATNSYQSYMSSNPRIMDIIGPARDWNKARSCLSNMDSIAHSAVLVKEIQSTGVPAAIKALATVPDLWRNRQIPEIKSEAKTPNPGVARSLAERFSPIANNFQYLAKLSDSRVPAKSIIEGDTQVQIAPETKHCFGVVYNEMLAVEKTVRETGDYKTLTDLKNVLSSMAEINKCTVKWNAVSSGNSALQSAIRQMPDLDFVSGQTNFKFEEVTDYFCWINQCPGYEDHSGYVHTTNYGPLVPLLTLLLTFGVLAASYGFIFLYYKNDKKKKRAAAKEKRKASKVKKAKSKSKNKKNKKKKKKKGNKSSTTDDSS